MTKRETAKAEIRAIFSNELECLSECEAKPERSTLLIFSRTVRLALMGAGEGKTCVSHIVYAIHRDGYWEQVSAHNGEWEAAPAAEEPAAEPPAPQPVAVRGGHAVDLGIDLTPAWSGVLPVLLLGYAEGTPEGQRLARTELERMARLADLHVAAKMAEKRA